jgi:formamidopyrimidine-DNA glycosylase
VPELPDVVVYVEALTAKLAGRVLERVHLRSPFVLRSVAPPIDAIAGQTVRGVRRLGKRIVLIFDTELFLVIHLMIAGRLRWRDPGAKLGLGPKIVQASFEFAGGTLFLTEAGSKKRAWIRLVSGEPALAALDPGGVEPLEIDLETVRAVLTRDNHTLKRALTDPHLFSGIGNAYSDEILHHARMSPVKLTSRLTDDEIRALHASIREVLVTWTDRLRARSGEFPEQVTAFQPEMAVHGKYGKPCPRCGGRVQRIRYADNEMNYCPACQTEGKLLADRSLSRLMRGDWPKTLEALEAKKERSRTTLDPD